MAISAIILPASKKVEPANGNSTGSGYIIEEIDKSKKLDDSSEDTEGSHQHSCCHVESSSTVFAKVSNNQSAIVAIIKEHNTSTEDHSPMFDAHCHLQLQPLYTNYHRHINNAQAAGVTYISVCGTCPGEDWRRLEKIHSAYPDCIIPNFGLHPWWIPECLSAHTNHDTNDECTPSNAVYDQSVSNTTADTYHHWETELLLILQRFPSAGVGECGLDKGIRKTVPMAVQEDILARHLRMARRFGRPVTLHCVGCWGRLYDVLNTELHRNDDDSNSSDSGVNSSNTNNTCNTTATASSGTTRSIPSVVLHSCNSMPPDMITLFNKLPPPTRVYYSLSASGISSECTCNTKLATLIKAIPLSQLLVETDSPDQLSAALKTKLQLHHNEPCLVRHTCSVIAAVLGMESSELAKIVRENAMTAYGVK